MLCFVPLLLQQFNIFCVWVCSPSVLDRLNALLEPGGSLTINERGVVDGTTPSITPHPNFRYIHQYLYNLVVASWGKTENLTHLPNVVLLYFPPVISRLFLTMDPARGEISRAMRNRGVEIYIPGENEGACWDSLDLKTNLHTLGVTGDCVCDLLMTVHSEIKSAIWGEHFQSRASVWKCQVSNLGLHYCSL